MANDALLALESLLENVPAWSADLKPLAKSAVEKLDGPHDQTAAERQRRPSFASRNSRKSPNRGANTPQTTAVPPTTPSTSQAADVSVSQQRKRKSSSVLSVDRNPLKLRARNIGTIFYDGDAQKQFERIVRAIGVNRNAVRRGKMCLKVDAMARSTSTSSNDSSASSSASSIGEIDLRFPGINPKPGRGRHMERTLFGSGANQEVEAFDRIDKHLEKGQNLCEHAAFTILRDGDCTRELRTATEEFVEAKRLAEIELPALRKKEAKAAERRQRDAEKKALEASNPKELASEHIKQLPDLVSFLPSDIKLEVDDLTADDQTDDDEVMDFSYPALSMKPHQLQPPSAAFLVS